MTIQIIDITANVQILDETKVERLVLLHKKHSV